MADLVNVNIYVVVKGYCDCPFSVNVGETFNVHGKMGESF